MGPRAQGIRGDRAGHDRRDVRGALEGVVVVPANAGTHTPCRLF